MKNTLFNRAFGGMVFCRHCGLVLEYDTIAGQYLHDYGRFDHDNGFYCYPQDTRFIADSRREEDVHEILDEGLRIG